MNKGLKKVVAATMALSAMLNIGTVGTAKTVKKSQIGLHSSYTNRDVAVRFAKKIAGHGYWDMPEDMQIQAHWCAAFTKVLYGHDKESGYNTVDNTIRYVTQEGGSFITDKTQEPHVGDLAIYNETAYGETDTYKTYDHIGIIYGTMQVDGVWWVKTIEGNSIDVNWEKDWGMKACDVDEWTYFYASDPVRFEDRHVVQYPAKKARQGQIVGWLSPRTVRKYYTVGDINGDGSINIADLVVIRRAFEDKQQHHGVLHNSYSDKYGVAELFYRCDLNGDGNFSKSDVSRLTEYITFGAETF